MTDTRDSLQRVIDEVLDEYAEIMNAYLFPSEHHLCRDCNSRHDEWHKDGCVGASILSGI